MCDSHGGRLAPAASLAESWVKLRIVWQPEGNMSNRLHCLPQAFKNQTEWCTEPQTHNKSIEGRRRVEREGTHGPSALLALSLTWNIVLNPEPNCRWKSNKRTSPRRFRLQA